MSDPATTLVSLLRATNIHDHAEVLKAANAAIKATKGDVHAQHTRAVALLKLDRCEDALRAIAEGGDGLERECLLEKAYALYKTGELEASSSALKSNKNSSRAFRHLSAQVAYRAEKFNEAVATYHQLRSEDGGIGGEENDLKINFLAVNAQLEWQGAGHLIEPAHKQPGREDMEAFETAYNAACGCIARNDYSKASILLKRARDMCEASEDLSETEKSGELLPILVQHAFVLTRLGKEEEAAALYRAITIAEIPEAPTRVVALNNQLSAGADGRNPFLTQRLGESTAQLIGNERLFEYQDAMLKQNKYVMDLQAKKFAGVERAAQKAVARSAGTNISCEAAALGAIGAVAQAQLSTGRQALKILLPSLEKRPGDVGLLLATIQLYVQNRNINAAIHRLEVFFKRLEVPSTSSDSQNTRFAPGLIALAVALYRRQGRYHATREELAKAASYWRQKASDSAASLLREAGVQLLDSLNPEDLNNAGSTFDSLCETSQHDKIAKAGLVASFATRDYSKVEPYLNDLTPVDRLTSGIDVINLIESGVVSVAVKPGETKKRAAEAEPEKVTKRRRKRKLSKEKEEGKAPDPERWLPLRDRSTYRPKGKKGKKRAQEATQGGMVKAEETLELVGGAGAVRVEKTSAAQTTKKKKKGKR